jgi:DNA-directed RNA polymerase subunit RPC12/RpoP
MTEHEERGERSIPEGSRAADARRSTGTTPSAGSTEQGAEGVLTLVCLTCGKEYYFSDEEPPAGITCEKCGNTVFRSFHSDTEEDEVAQDFEDSTARDLDPDDAEGETLPGDVIDLNRD